MKPEDDILIKISGDQYISLGITAEAVIRLDGTAEVLPIITHRPNERYKLLALANFVAINVLEDTATGHQSMLNLLTPVKPEEILAEERKAFIESYKGPGHLGELFFRASSGCTPLILGDGQKEKFLCYIRESPPSPEPRLRRVK